MKFRMYFGWLKTLLISLVIAAGVAIVIFDIVLLVGVGSLKTANPVVAGVSLAAAAIIAIAASLLLFNSYYKFGDEDLIVTMGFFSDKVDYRNIESVRENAVTHELFIVAVDDEEDEQIKFRLNLPVAKNKKFISRLKDECAFLIVEEFNPPEKKKKK